MIGNSFRPSVLLSIVLFASVILIIPCAAISANHYVRSGATGSHDGSDWTNAWPQLPSTLVRGDTYFIADGTYPSYSFDDAESGSTYTYIKKATASDHGIETGWQGSYGDGQVEFTNNGASQVYAVQFKTGYWQLNGQSGNRFDGTSYGFKIQGANVSGSKCIRIDNTSGVNFITIRYVYFEHQQNPSDTQTMSWQMIYTNPTSGINSNLTIANNLFRGGVNAILIRNTDNSFIEYNHFDHNYSNYTNHGCAISAYYGNNGIVVRYNEFRDICGTAFIAFFGDGWDIYGNIFYHTPNVSGGVGMGILSTSSGYTATNVQFHNNTIVNVGYYKDSNSGIQNYGTSTGYAYNNLWYNCRDIVFNGITAHEFNAIGSITGRNDSSSEPNIQSITTDPFVASGSHNYSLAFATDDGYDLSSPYNRDMLGNTRGADGVVDRGALEFDSGIPVSVSGVSPSPPANLTIVSSE